MTESIFLGLLGLVTLCLSVVGYLQAKEISAIKEPLALLERRCGLSGIEIEARSRVMPPAMRAQALLSIMPSWDNVVYPNGPPVPEPALIVEPSGPPSPTRFERLE